MKINLQLNIKNLLYFTIAINQLVMATSQNLLEAAHNSNSSSNEHESNLSELAYYGKIIGGSALFCCLLAIIVLPFLSCMNYLLGNPLSIIPNCCRMFCDKITPEETQPINHSPKKTRLSRKEDKDDETIFFAGAYNPKKGSTTIIF